MFCHTDKRQITQNKVLRNVARGSWVNWDKGLVLQRIRKVEKPFNVESKSISYCKTMAKGRNVSVDISIIINSIQYILDIVYY